jgi:hypothetical protein
VPGRPIRSLVAEDRSARGVRDRAGPEELPRRLQRLANHAVVAEDEPHPQLRLVLTLPGFARVILAGRATSVPFTPVPTGHQGTTTDNAKAVATCAASFLRRSGSRPIRLWEQGFVSSDHRRAAVVTYTRNVCLSLRDVSASCHCMTTSN